MKLNQIIDVLSFLGSFGIFIYGLKHMSESLQRIAGEKLRGLFSRLTQKSIYAVFLGFVLTGIIQSSSATTVIIVGFVNAGVLSVAQSIPTIMGANIGTTITGFLVSFFCGCAVARTIKLKNTRKVSMLLVMVMFWQLDCQN